MTPATDEELHAYADGQLPEARRLAFEQAMARDPALAAHVAEVRRQNASLRDALDGLLAEPVPQRLLDAARPPARGTAWRRLLAPIAVFLACYTGAFDEADDCMSERMLAQPTGPVAVICGTRVTMPYANAVLGHAMLEECFAREPATLGVNVLYERSRR